MPQTEKNPPTAWPQRYPWNMAQPVRYPWNGKIVYQAINANCLLVRQGDDWGYFTRDAEWLEGPLKTADPTYCRWVSSDLFTGQDRVKEMNKA